jgi:eukaryotic-like serine/threonine-protein kinase
VTLAAGSKLGPYEVLGQLGAGGMGEVYRARDPRLGREVAIKVLPPSFSSDADRLRRFEQEAKAAGVLNHPNITAVYDIGQHEGAPYVVQELLEGETLRAVLAGGKISPRKAVDYALQTARGLAAAHEKGIVHRDLKPENLFITRDGRIKILDFGLAKLTQPEGAGSAVTSLPTETRGTEPGVVLGTLGYMSPEQVRGRSADARSDIFSFGAILYEMLSGNRAFRGDSAADTMSAILREDPPDLSVTNQSISPGLERIVRHCLEKNPEQRFHSAHDLAFDLEALSGTSGQAAVGVMTAGRGRRLSWLTVVVAAGIVLAALALGSLLKPKGPTLSFQRITYRRGLVGDARFAPDGQTVLYSAAWDGKPPEIFAFTPGSPESRALGISGVRLETFAVSPTGELAVALPRLEGETEVGSTLARVPFGGGAPRPVLEDVMAVDWSRDGKSLAVARDVNGRVRLEFPVGKVLFESSGSISYPRVSPQGDRIAFIDRPIYERPQGRVMLVGLAGRAKVLSEGWRDVQGIAWRPDGKEIWFTATTRSEGRALHAVTPDGKTRLVSRMPGSPWLYDISRDGRVLIDQWSVRSQIAALPPGETRERDLSWLDGSILSDISPDGKRIVFSEMGQGGGENSGVYIRGTDGSPAVRLGEGTAFGFSRDVKWALTTLPRAASQLILLPIGSGEPRELPRGKINYELAWMLPDGKEVVFIGTEPGHGVRTYVQRLDGSPPRAITPDGIWASAVTPDGSVVAAQGPADLTAKLYPIAGGEPRTIPGIAAGERVYGWSADGHRIFVMAGSSRPLPRTVFRIDLASGKREQWRELAPADLTGISGFRAFCVAQDETSYAYSYTRGQSEMYIVEGLK